MNDRQATTASVLVLLGIFLVCIMTCAHFVRG